MNDLKFACRQLLKNPGFTAVAVLTLALGIGATTAIFGVINAHLLDPIPGENEQRLVQINEIDLRDSRPGGASAFLVQELIRHRDTFEKLTANRSDALELVGEEFLEHVWGSQVTPEFFEFFDTQPSLGRWLTQEETESAVEDVLVISHDWWQSRFGGDPAVLGRRLKAKDTQATEATYTIIGVMPPHFQFPSRETRYWRPLRFAPAELAIPVGRNYEAFARLSPGVSIGGAQAVLDTLTARPSRDFPSDSKDYVIKARPMRDFFIAPEVRRTLWSAAVAVGFVLLIVCANLGNLQLARGESRLKELSVRSALGAGRWRLIQQLLTESVVLSLLGGAGSLLLALWLRPILESLVPGFAPVLRSTGLDGAMFAWTLGIATTCGIAFGLYPAWRATKGRLSDSLKDSAHTTSTGWSQRWFRHSLVVMQVALALMLLTGAGLLVRSIVQLLRTDPGLDPASLVTVWPGVRSERYPTWEQQRAVTQDIATRLAALPGTTAVGVAQGRGSSYHFVPDKAEPFRVSVVLVGTGDTDFFRALGARLKQGRWLEPSDDHEGQHAAMVNETLAALFWPGESAIGKRFYDVGPQQQVSGPKRIYDVVGVVRNFSEWRLGTKQGPTCFVPLAGHREPLATTYYVRTALDPASLGTGVRRVSKEIIPGSHAPEIVWVERELYASTATRRMLTVLLSALAAVGLFLSMLGVFGVLLHAVLQRTKEIGIRMALGAQQRDVLAMVLRQGLRLVGVGLLIGLAGALALARLLRGLLFGVSPSDPITFAAVPLLLLCVALLACWLPARRAAKVDPMEALRYE
ncbi:MAG: hypothetical protein DME22_15050 [Verrucomicrobia bacterium]|nr:MAG: hypothetical protein DME22_15050 [Verrucomicrobiota bacterium]PYJ98548.1 MAG: hypothetical protein DME23_11810 [Verrucomicrobiota bacterium]